MTQLRDPEHWRSRLASSSLPEKLTVYEEALQIWPNSTELWLGYIQDTADVVEKEKLLSKALPNSVDPVLYAEYINFVQQTRPTELRNAYDYALSVISCDPTSGDLWRRFIDFLNSESFENEWENHNRLERVRAAYKQAVTIPLVNIEALWRSFNAFENKNDRLNARRLMDERSGAYMKARSALKSWQTVAANLNTTTMQSPADSDASSTSWRQMIEWERQNLLELSEPKLKERIDHACRRATHSARWSVILWFDAGLYSDSSFFEQGAETMPESALLAFKAAEQFEVQNQVADVRRVCLRLAESLQQVGEDPTPAYAELVRSTNRLEGVGPARACVVECLKSLESPTGSLYIAAASLEPPNSAKERAVWSLAYRKFGRTSSEFVVQYLQYLFKNNDVTNARSVFEQTADQKNRKVWDTMLMLESQHVQNMGACVKALKSLESRYIAEFHDIDELELFIQRYGSISSLLPRQIEARSSPGSDDSAAPQSGVIAQLLAMLPPASVYDGPKIDNDVLIKLVLNAV